MERTRQYRSNNRWLILSSLSVIPSSPFPLQLTLRQKCTRNAHCLQFFFGELRSQPGRPRYTTCINGVDPRLHGFHGVGIAHGQNAKRQQRQIHQRRSELRWPTPNWTGPPGALRLPQFGAASTRSAGPPAQGNHNPWAGLRLPGPSWPVWRPARRQPSAETKC
jgi:hypothetical protein